MRTDEEANAGDCAVVSQRLRLCPSVSKLKRGELGLF